MLTISIPDGPNLSLEHLTLDLNGTLAVDGLLLPGVSERLWKLAADLSIYLITANTHGGAEAIAAALGVEFVQLEPGPGAAQKETFIRRLGADRAAAIGNGVNDAAMLRTAALGVAVCAAEGVALPALQAADIYVPNILDALDLLLKPNRLRASLRG